MLKGRNPEAIEYLVIGHLSRDLTPQGDRLGGTAAYAALTARALGLKTGIVTSYADDMPLSALQGLSVINLPAEYSTTFENIETPAGRRQVIHSRAQLLAYQHIPEAWGNAPIIHLAPIAQEVAPDLVRYLSEAFIVITPQGWLREWNASGQIRVGEWPEARFVLENAAAAVFSIEDIGNDETRIEELIHTCPVVAVTEGSEGVRVYWHGDVRRFRPPAVEVVDTTGAGDIFAAVFFARLYQTRDPWEAARVATALAACSVTRVGLDGIPTPDEIAYTTIEVF
ncbi:MAG: PfkB family carbohydrate kinase [Anaerolineales bacterium]